MPEADFEELGIPPQLIVTQDIEHLDAAGHSRVRSATRMSRMSRPLDPCSCLFTDHPKVLFQASHFTRMYLSWSLSAGLPPIVKSSLIRSSCLPLFLASQ